MTISRYVKGRSREYRTMSMLKNDGWLVSRSAASHGAVDVFAARGGKMLLIQVKSGRARVKKDELQALVEWGKQSSADAEIWHFKDGGTVVKRRVHAAREAPP